MGRASPFRRRARRALGNPVLARNVLRATDTSLAHRREVVAERPDWEDLRERAAALRRHTLARLDRYLREFAENARARGVQVHAARDARAAARLVSELARRKGATRILKAKSMATEEIELNAALARRGFRPLETDLGEYIVQLAGERPSHLTAPALHRSAEEIRDLFLREGVIREGTALPRDRRALARRLSLSARETLRSRLLEADLGVTGANFLVAETGTVVLVENEGNIRFTTTTPPVVVAVAGIDKVIPRLADLGILLPLLTRSATGQRAAAGVSLLSGGPGERHVVLLDNGRTRMLADPEDREILACIRCGACLNTCPVYRSVGGHAYGWIYPGPIGALLAPLLRGRGEDWELPFASTLCGACAEICPVKIPLHEHLLRLRARAARAGRRGIGERIGFRAFRFLAGREDRFRLAARLARRMEGPLLRLGLLAAWTAAREAPRMARPAFHEMRGDHGPAAS